MSRKRRAPSPALTPALVREWNDEQGWGVLDTSVTPGGCWVHFSHLRMPGYRSLTVGQRVWIEFEAASQDGFDHRATQVQLSGNPDDRFEEPDPGPPSAAYRSSLTVALDDGRVLTPDEGESPEDFLARVAAP